ncbi:hypothetical protein LJB88_04790, partial [Erysipelotrichaceae bacterium OttesenSCG-928-M19]|nr:hypothetical protein [Erysipelotrichaceae bacterium OttesenSCG-928-M19]
NKEKTGTCSKLTDSVIFYDQLVNYEKKYDAIIKQSKEASKKKNTNDNNDGNKTSLPDYSSDGNKSNKKKENNKKTTKPKQSKPKKDTKKPDSTPKPKEDSGTACWVGINC